MTHVFTHPQQSDPIHTLIERHRAAYDAFQVAPEGKLSLIASDDYDAASEALTSTACASRFGALALLAHLRWWLAEEAQFKDGHQPAYSIAEARAADLTLFLGTNLPPVVIPQAAPSGRLGTTRLLSGVERYRQAAPLTLPNEDPPGSIEPWQAIEPYRPDTATARALRVMDIASNLLAAIAIIGGGMVLTGFASLH